MSVSPGEEDIPQSDDASFRIRKEPERWISLQLLVTFFAELLPVFIGMGFVSPHPHANIAATAHKLAINLALFIPLPLRFPLVRLKLNENVRNVEYFGYSGVHTVTQPFCLYIPIL
jgi:hypothetical protein